MCADDFWRADMEVDRDATQSFCPQIEGGNLHSCLYECSVMHHRLVPRKNRFDYKLFFFCLDLDRIDDVASKVSGFSRNKWNLYSFRDKDHFDGETNRSVKESLIAYLSEHGVVFPQSGRALLITLPRVLGYIFNPVSFYFCFEADGTPFAAVTEVGNTFGEIKPYLLSGPPKDGVFRLRVPKHFYVSPFSALDLEFDFKLRVPGEELEVHINDMEGDQVVLLSTLVGKRAPLTTASLAWFTLKYPLITVKVIVSIHWQAFLLWTRRLPFHSKVANKHLQRDVLKAHTSIANESK